jgi:hypothetical protein
MKPMRFVVAVLILVMALVVADQALARGRNTSAVLTWTQNSAAELSRDFKQWARSVFYGG